MVAAKADLVSSMAVSQRVAELRAQFIESEHRLAWVSDIAVVSSKTGSGLSELLARVEMTGDDIVRALGDELAVPHSYREIEEVSR